MDDAAIKRALEAIRGTLQLYWPERFAYLGGTIFALALLCYAAFRRVNTAGFDLAQAGYLFGSGGLFAYTGARVLIFMRPSFQLINDLIRHVNGLGG